MLSSEVVLSGRYRLDERVATGGMGDVWRGTDQVLGRQVAVKVLLPALVSDPDFIARFRAEARIMAALRHPGIVQVFDCGEDDLPDGGRADYLVMEFVDGEPLSKRIEAAGKLGVAETMSIVAQAAQALNAAHRGGIVHRDVKPGNLLVQEDGSVVLVDFGVARSTNVTSITSTNAVPGTALYMAPEQAAGRPVSGATDIYALGAVTYCCLTGTPPFTGDNPLQVAVRHLDDEPPELPHDIPEAVRALVSRALAKDPADRFSSGAAMAEAAR
ncbi:serine/threonine-protein kinase, partial [Micromonospora azadirachtae]